MELSEIVCSFMAHKPCGKHIQNGEHATCITAGKGKCNAHMPKQWQNNTDPNVDSYALYRRRQYYDSENTLLMPTKKKFVTIKKTKSQATLENQWIPGYNPALLMKYRIHINVE